MTANIGWLPGCGDHESGDLDTVAQTITRKGRVIGSAYAATTETLALAYAPLMFRGRFRQNITYEAKGAGVCFFTVTYGPFPKWPGSYRINFETTGGSVRAVVSKSVVSKHGADCPYTVGLAAPINAQDGQPPEGIEVVIPMARRSYTIRTEAGALSEALMDYYEACTGLVNSNPWHGRLPGEVLFLGATGSTSMSPGSIEAELTLSMALSRNATLTIGALANIVKDGHDVLDVIWEPDESGGQPLRKEKWVLIHRVFDRDDFQQRFGF